MLQIIRTNSEHEDFIKLVRLLDKELAVYDGDDHAFYDQYNKIDAIKHAVVAYFDNEAVGCGAIKEYDMESTEVKRMYTKQESRSKGVASQILIELENWAKELGYKKTILETGKRQVEAVQLYNKRGYRSIPNYGQYTGVDNSLCFEKSLK